MFIANYKNQFKNPNARSKFRKLLFMLSKTAREKNISAFEAYASRAILIAKAERSKLMMAMAHLQLANAYLLVEQLKPALNNFCRATVEARASRKRYGLIATEIEIQSLNGEGSVFFAMENYAVAGEVYKEAAETAESAGQYLSVVDGWLMATFCHELRGLYVDAYRCCECALLMGEKLPKHSRPQRGLAQVGDTLLRIVNQLKTDQFAGLPPQAFSQKREIDLRMTNLIGKSWQKHVPGKE
jgi:tetratricopeptide (TPR) repeat protein